MVNDYSVLGTNRPGKPDLFLSCTSTGARDIACTLSTQTLLKEKGFFPPVCLRLALQCTDPLERNIVPIIMPLPSPSLTEACRRDRLGSGGFTPTPSRLSGLLSHKYSAPLLEEQLAEVPADTSASGIWLHILVPNRSISYQHNQEKFPKKEENKIVLSSSRP